MPSWGVQKRDATSERWYSLRGADTWFFGPFGGYWKEEPCRGEPVHMAIHTSVSKPAENQMIVYTDTFIVKSGGN